MGELVGQGVLGAAAEAGELVVDGGREEQRLPTLVGRAAALAHADAAAGLSGASRLEGRVGGVGGVHVLAHAAGLGAVDAALVRQEGAAQQRALALGTAEAALGGVPVEAVVRHLSVIHTWQRRNIDGYCQAWMSVLALVHNGAQQH